MALTHQAEAQEFAVKVQNLLAELNKQNSKKVRSGVHRHAVLWLMHIRGFTNLQAQEVHYNRRTCLSC
jgi:hypothetical protein